MCDFPGILDILHTAAKSQEYVKVTMHLNLLYKAEKLSVRPSVCQFAFLVGS